MSALAIGQRAQISRRFTVADINALTNLVTPALVADDLNITGTRETRGDNSPSEKLATTADSLIPVPRSLLGGLFSYLLGTQLPGSGTIYLKQQLEFIASAYCEEELTATVEIREIKPEKRLVTLSTQCTDSKGKLICQGSALVLANRE